MFETPESRWRALQTRNPLAASVFLYGVTTTRIYCRPTCPSRLARQANVVFFDSATHAECAGFRACKRCKPSQSDFEPKKAQHDKAVRKACELMDAAGGRLSLENLASSVNLSPRYFHGIFKAVMGVTPNVYAMSMRKAKVIRALPGSEKPEKPRMRSEGSSLRKNKNKGATISENGFPLIELPLDKNSHGPEDYNFGLTGLEMGYCGNLDCWFQDNVFLTSENVFGDGPVSLGNHEDTFSSLGHAEVHDVENTIGHGAEMPSITQLPNKVYEESFLFFGDVPSTCSWGRGV